MTLMLLLCVGQRPPWIIVVERRFRFMGANQVAPAKHNHIILPQYVLVRWRMCLSYDGQSVLCESLGPSCECCLAGISRFLSANILGSREFLI
jgi:hypothetical protein